MDRRQLTGLMIGLGVVAVVALFLWGLLAAGSDPVFWLIAVAFSVVMAWDVSRHLRELRRTDSLDPGRPR